MSLTVHTCTCDGIEKHSEPTAMLCICYHQIGGAREELQQTFPGKLPEMMVTAIDVLGARAKLGQAHQLQCSQVVLEDLAADMRVGANNFEAFLLNFLK